MPTAKNGVSFILYGPPGSGKTFVVSKFAKALGWPLLNLYPGYFIQEGLESIEAVAGNIFVDLMRLDHTVVFFDECDELFRDRDLNGDGFRNILSFATASMLPKLQKLHDARKVIFILGTNYVRNIDTAIRRPGRFDAILLFDRPDHDARVAIAKDILAKKQKVSQSTGGGILLSAKTVADVSDGWMIEQVIAYANSARSLKLPVSPSTTDYRDWCTKDGKKELVAAGVDTPTINRVLERWAPHIDSN